MSALALSLLRPLDHGTSPIDHAPASIGELAALSVPPAPTPSESAPELLRLGPALPSITAPRALEAAPAMTLLADVARIGVHLGPLERAERALSEAERGVVSERLARVRVLVDCASALADLRVGVLASMRTARAA